MRIAVLGASGFAGREIARLSAPLVSPKDEFLLVGRSEARLEETRRLVDEAAGRSIATVRRFDLTRDEGLGDLLAGVGLTIVTASLPERTAALARAALDAGSHWFDIMLSGRRKLDALKALAPEMERMGRRFITDGGFHPGLPAAMIRHAATRIEKTTRGEVYAALKMDWRADRLSDSTIDELLDEFADFDMRTFVDGRERVLPPSEYARVDFGGPIGVKTCVPMPLDEMTVLPAILPDLRTAGFHIAGFNIVADWVVGPLLCLAGRVRPLRRATRPLARWAVGRLWSSPPPHAVIIRLLAEGVIGGRVARTGMEIRGSDPYLLTAVPAVACVRRLLDGSITRAGLSHQALAVDPRVFFDDMRELGLEIVEEPVIVG